MRFPSALFSSFRACAGAAAAWFTPAAVEGANLTMDPNPAQALAGWGFTPSPIDWDNRPVLRDGAVAERLLKDSGANLVRVTVPPVVSYSANQEFKGAGLDRTIVPQIKDVATFGVAGYMLTFLSPLSDMKTLYASKARIDGEPSVLNPEKENDFAGYIATVLDYLRRQNLQLPVAVSIQCQPDEPESAYGTPPNTPNGCIYAPEQWHRVVRKVRAALDGKDCTAIGLVGPETFGLERFRALAAASRPAGAESADVDDVFAGLAYVSAHSQPWATEEETRAAEFCRSAQAKGLGVWALGPCTHGVQTDAEMVVRTFEQLIRDLVDCRADHWFWRYGYTREVCGESLLRGNDAAEAPVYTALKQLWHAAPAGARVHPLLRANGAPGESDAEDGRLRGVAFSLSSRTVIVVVNPGDKPGAVRITGFGAGKASVDVHPRSGATAALGAGDTTSEIALELAPMTVAIATITRSE